MLIRQRCLLYMIERAGRPVTRLELTKWAFLLRRETPAGGGTTFYDFVPYRLGPFSFTLFREADGLVRDGYLREASAGKAWERVADVEGDNVRLPCEVQSDAARIVDRFVDRDAGELLDYVYERFPWYTVNSSIRRLTAPRVAEQAVYTVGYQQWSVDRLLDEVMLAGISRIIDVRSNPVARRYGFHKSTLRRLLAKLDIEYEHHPSVGIPSAWRRGLETPAQFMTLFRRYEAERLPNAEDSVIRISEKMMETSSVLLCSEHHPIDCHRSRLAAVVQKHTGLGRNDLRVPTQPELDLHAA